MGAEIIKVYKEHLPNRLNTNNEHRAIKKQNYNNIFYLLYRKI